MDRIAEHVTAPLNVTRDNQPSRDSHGGVARGDLLREAPFFR